MSAALQALRSIIDNSSRTTMRALTPALFLDTERPTYDFLSSFYTRHGALPSADIMRENGFILPAASGPLNYYLERLRDRAVYTAAAAAISDLDAAVQARDIAEIRRVVASLGREVAQVEGQRDLLPIHELFSQVLAEALIARMAGATGMTGVPFGWYPMDHATAGAQPGDVISVVARPNVGKSWTIIHMALSAWLAGHSVFLLSMEMTGIQMARRLLAEMTGINPDHIRKGQITPWGEERLIETIEGVPGMAPFHVMTGSFRKTTSDLDRAIQEFGPDIALADASYLIGTEKKQRRDGSRWERIYDVGEEIKGIAQDRNLPVVQSLQLNRDKKEGVAFDMNQIAGGDVIGQISSVVVAVDFPDDPVHKPVRRKYIGGKNREGSLFEFETNFLFSPVNFDVIEREQEEDHVARLTAQL